MNLPRLMNDDGSISKILHPLSVSITLNIVPLSYASIKMQMGEQLPMRGIVELFSPYGSVGMFRVRTPNNVYGDDVSSAELEHSIAEVGDYLVKEQIDEMINPQTAMTKIFKHYKGQLWKLGSVKALGTANIALSVNYNRVLDAMLMILEQKPDCMMQFDFSKRPWVVSIVKKGTVVEAEGRLSRNVTSAKISYDDTELCTRAYYEAYSKDKKGNVVGTWKYKDADTLKKYGVIEREISTSSDMTDAEISTVVNTYLSEHKNPKVSVSIDGLELSSITKESLDKFVLGKLFRLAIPEYNVVLEDNITYVSWDDVYSLPRSVTIRIGNEMDTVVTFLHNLDSTGSGGGGGGGGRKKEEEKWKEYETHITQTDYLIDLNATRVNRANEILEKAGLSINSKGVLIYATDKKNKNLLSSKLNVLSDKITTSVKNAKEGLESRITQTAGSLETKITNSENRSKSRIKQQSDRIDIVVEGTGKDAKVKTASIVAGINDQEGSFVKISASKINLSGYVTMSDLESTNASISNLINGTTIAQKIKASIIEATTTLTYGSYSVKWGYIKDYDGNNQMVLMRRT